MDDLHWTPAHAELHRVMKREIETLRELLANLHQEELLILQKETSYWKTLMEERRALVEQLNDLKQSRLVAIKSLEESAVQTNLSLEQLLPLSHASSWEILSLRDQILTLSDRMSLQSSRNEMLTQLAHHQSELKPVQKKKITLATESRELYNNEDDAI